MTHDAEDCSPASECIFIERNAVFRAFCILADILAGMNFGFRWTQGPELAGRDGMRQINPDYAGMRSIKY
jgi:hypothetical protein